MRGRPARCVGASLLLAATMSVALALAYWSAAGAGTATAHTAWLAAATIGAPASAYNTVTITWTQQASLQPASAANSSITYSVQRRLGGDAWTVVSSGGCSGDQPYGAASCVDTLPASGSYSYRVVAAYGTWTATSAAAGPVSGVVDATGPIGGSVDASGLVGTGARYATALTLSLTLAKGTDPAGMAAGGAQLRRSTATLTSTGGADGACGAYSTPAVQVGALNPVSPVAETVPAGQACYRYEYDVADTVGNHTTYTSPDIKVDTTAPSAPAFAFSALTNTSWNGSTLFYRSTATSGAFTVTASATDPNSGIASYALPALGAGWTATAGTLGVSTYSWGAAGPAAPVGAQNATAANHATLASPAAGFTLTSDVTAPATGSVTYTDGYRTAASVSVSFTAGTDPGGAGVSPTARLLQRGESTLAEAPAPAAPSCPCDPRRGHEPGLSVRRLHRDERQVLPVPLPRLRQRRQPGDVHEPERREGRLLIAADAGSGRYERRQPRRRHRVRRRVGHPLRQLRRQGCGGRQRDHERTGGGSDRDVHGHDVRLRGTRHHDRLRGRHGDGHDDEPHRVARRDRHAHRPDAGCRWQPRRPSPTR